MSDRIDMLLARALADWQVPADATPDERVEVERLIAVRRDLGSQSTVLRAEAEATSPAARARFHRFVVTAQRPAAEPRRRWAAGRTWSAGLVAAAAAIAVLIAIVVASPFDGVETASAQVLSPGDYVQVEGLVSATGGSGANATLEVQSAFGDLDVAFDEETSGVDSGTPAKGDTVIVAGVVGEDRKIRARSVTVAATGLPAPARLSFQRLKELRANLVGKVITVTLSSDGTTGRALIDTGDGKQYLVVVDGKSAGELLTGTARALGAQVEVSAGQSVGDGVFELTIREGGTTEQPSAATVKGTITQRTGNVLIVATGRGPATVVMRMETRLLPGRSGLLREAIQSPGGIVGYTVSVTGAIDRATGRLIADVVVLWPKPAR